MLQSNQSQPFLPSLENDSDFEPQPKPPLSPQPKIQLQDLIQKLKQKSRSSSKQFQDLSVTPLNANELLEVSKSNHLSLIQLLPYLGDSKEENQKIRREQPFTKFKDLTELSTEFASKFRNTFQKLQQTSSVQFNNSRLGATFFKASPILITEESVDDIKNSISVVKSTPHRELQLSLLHNKVNMEQQESIENQKIQEYENEFKITMKKSKKLKQMMNKRMNVFPQHEQKLLMRNIKQENNKSNETKKQTTLEKIPSPEIPLNYQYNVEAKIACFFYYSTSTNFGPNSREGSTMFSLGNKIYLIGGMGVSCVEDVFQLDVNKNICQWKPIQLQSDNIHQIYARLNHTVCIYKNQVIIFGGEIVTNKGLQRIRESTNETKILNFGQNYQKLFKVTYQSRTVNFSNYIEPRKGHTAVVIGKSMLVHGGINRQGQYLREIIILDLVNLKWNQAIFYQGEFYRKGVSFHACCLILNQFNKTSEIYQKKVQNTYLNQREGVLFFGGVDSQGDTYNQLKLLIFDTKPMYFELLKPSGITPKGRSKHTMNYHETLGIVIIAGGFSYDGVFLNDLTILDFKFMTWMQVIRSGKEFLGRCGHSATLLDSRIYIFGGYNEKGFLNVEVVVGEFDNNMGKNTEKIQIIKGREGYNPSLERQIQKQKVLTMLDSSKLELTQKLNDRDMLIRKLQFKTEQQTENHPPHLTTLFDGMLKSNFRFPTMKKIIFQDDEEKRLIKRKNSIVLVADK